MSLAMQRLTTDIRFSLIMFARNRQSLFFSFIFPVLFLVVLGYLLQGPSAIAGTGDGNGASQIEYLLPGIIGICIMFSAISETTGSIVKYRASGTFKKLLTTPLSSFELNASHIVTGMITVLLSLATALVMAWLIFGIAPAINAVSILAVTVGAVTFVGLGMVMAYLVTDTDSVNTITYIVIIPLIVISGALFPVERLPGLVQFVSALSPLTYLINGLRGSMFGSSYTEAIVNTALCGFLCLMLFSIGVAILMSREDG